MDLKITGLAVFMSLAFAANAASQQSADDSHLFDALEGEWILHTYFLQADGGRVEQDAELIVTRMESQQAPVFMFEERHGSLDDSGLFIGRVMYAYHHDTNKWRGAGVNTLANRKWRDVSIVDGEIVIIETGELFGGRPGQNRFTYFNIADDRFEFRSEHSADGEVWQPSVYGFVAERRGRPKP